VIYVTFSRSFKTSQVHPQEQTAPLVKHHRESEPQQHTRAVNMNHVPHVFNVQQLQQPKVVSAVPQVLSVHQIPQVLAFPFANVPQVVQPSLGASR